MRLKDKVAVITGAASGIGRAIADRFAEEGAVIIVADMNEAGMHKAVAELQATGARAAGYAVDVTDRDQVHAVMNQVAAGHGRIDILINNAGITRYRPFTEMNSEDWNLILDVDLKGVFFCAQAAAPHMVRRQYGKIVNISSSHGTGVTPHATAGSPGGVSAYASAKAGVIMLTKVLARELGPNGINVNSVAPGTFLTPLNASTRSPEELKAHIEHRKRTNVLGRLGTLTELANTVLFFASDDSSYVTGHTLFVDGGRVDRM